MVRGWTEEEVYDEYVQDMALKRVTTAQDVANAVLFLASDDAPADHRPAHRRGRRVGRMIGVPRKGSE